MFSISIAGINMNVLLVSAVCIIVFAYIKLYLKPKKDIQLLQANLSNFNSGLLIEKQPILIFDKVVNPQNVIDVFFKYMYHLSNTTTTPNGSHVQNLSRFAVIHNDQDDVQDISIQKYQSKAHSNSKNMYYANVTHQKSIETLTIRLPAKNIIILPYLYSFKSDRDLPVTYLSDFIHVFF